MASTGYNLATTTDQASMHATPTSSDAMWAAQIPWDDLVHILQSLPPHLEHTGLCISSNKVGALVAPPLMTENPVGVPSTSDGSTSVQGKDQHEHNQLTFGTLPIPLDVHPTPTVSMSMLSWTSTVTINDLSESDIEAIMSLCVSQSITVATLCHTLCYIYNLPAWAMELLVRTSHAQED